MIFSVAMFLSLCGFAPAHTPRLFHETGFGCQSFAMAVNYFVGLGKDKSVKELNRIAESDLRHEILGRTSINERIGWLCRVLFVPKGRKCIREPQFGAHHMAWMDDPNGDWPLLPMCQSGSSYFVISEGLSGGGLPETVKHFLEYCSEIANFRTVPIHVPSRAEAYQDAASLRKSPQWRAILWAPGLPVGMALRVENECWDFIRQQADMIPESGAVKSNART